MEERKVTKELSLFDWEKARSDACDIIRGAKLALLAGELMFDEACRQIDELSPVKKDK